MTVQTVTGPVDGSELGFTLFHEHVVMNAPEIALNWPHLFDREALRAKALAAMQEAKDLGVGTLIDLTPGDYHREPQLVRELSEATGVHVVHATGGYWVTSPFFRMAPMERLAELFRHDIEVGMNGTEVRAGIIKVATDFEGVTNQNGRLLRAAAQVQRETGVPISTHTNMKAKTGLEQQRIFREEGVDLAHVVIGHSNDTDDVPYLEQLIEGGSYIGMDRFGLDNGFGLDARIDLLVTMCERGYAERIVVAHDRPIEANFAGRELGDGQPDWSWNTIPSRVVPEAKKRGVSDEQIRLMTVENPRRVFEG